VDEYDEVFTTENKLQKSLQKAALENSTDSFGGEKEFGEFVYHCVPVKKVADYLDLPLLRRKVEKEQAREAREWQLEEDERIKQQRQRDVSAYAYLYEFFEGVNPSDLK